MNLAIDRSTLKDVFSRTATALHTLVYTRTGGKLGGKVGGLTMGILTTTGRRSGQPRATPLNVMADGDRWLLVASNGGDDRPPQWLQNLRANPEATLQLGTESFPVRATVTIGEEKKSLWPKVVAAYKGYDSYQRKTTRDIPVVILTRVT